MAIKTLDLRPAATSTSRAQKRTIEQIVGVSVPLEVAKIIRVAPAFAVTQRDHTRTRALVATYAAPAARLLCNTSESGKCASNFESNGKTSDTSANDGNRGACICCHS